MKALKDKEIENKFDEGEDISKYLDVKLILFYQKTGHDLYQ